LGERVTHEKRGDGKEGLQEKMTVNKNREERRQNRGRKKRGWSHNGFRVSEKEGKQNQRKRKCRK